MTKRDKYIGIALLVLAFLYWRYKKKGYIIGPKKVSDNEKEEKSDSLTKYDLGEVDYRANGIYVFNVDYQKKTFNYLAVGDNESFQGKYEWNNPDELRKPNNSGQAKLSTGWLFTYNKKVQQGTEFVSLTLDNSLKKTRFNKVVDFTHKKIG